MKREIGTCLLGSLLLAGCSYPDPRPNYDWKSNPAMGAGTVNVSPLSRTTAASAASKPWKPGETVASAAATKPTWQPYRQDPAATAKAAAPVTKVVKVPEAGKPVIVTVSHEEPAAAAVIAEPAPLPQTFAAVQTLAAAPETVHIGFSRAPDYTWLNGQVQYIRSTRAWRLRYARLDQEDTHGGSVTLTAVTGLDGLQDGQYVLVRGRLVNPDSPGIAPAYRVDQLVPGSAGK